ncbi:MAG: multifunctional oxoglutarate decarboxylase/oxoglutarate dehydrogenase thiamine pyrophosphate-binding subunit/dihydrolipoyllysine-residue succinyltransferase subunit [Acidimicrobiales bacterium]
MPGQEQLSPYSFGPNAWLVDEMFEDFCRDPSSVSDSWREFFEGYRPGGANLARTAATAEGAPGSVRIAPAVDEGSVTATQVGPVAEGVATQLEGARVAQPGSGRRAAGGGAGVQRGVTPSKDEEGSVVVLKGAPARLAENMTSSLSVPTATSTRSVPAKLLEVNRLIVNNHLSRTGVAGKVSFTHLIGWAVVKALQVVPAVNSSFTGAAVAGKHNGQRLQPAVVRPAHVNLGVAVDVARTDGSRALMVPVVKKAQALSFREFWRSYEELVHKVRSGKAGVDDFSGATVTLTNPGTFGTAHSVPRLLPGQGAIIAVGNLGYPAEWQGADPRQLADLGVGKVVTISCTYDHRVVQGAESGALLQQVHRLLMGEDGFYDDVFKSLGVPYKPVEYHQDANDPFDREQSYIDKQQKAERLVNAYRVRGHLIAHLGPLGWEEPQMHPELDIATYGLTVWDLDREFYAQGLAGRERMRLGDILSILRDAYCRTVGVEYMHIMEPAEKQWIQQHVEGVTTDLTPEEHRHVLFQLNAAEALEQFLNTKYVGQKRFGLEGAESAVPLLGALLDKAADQGHRHAVMGMAHRGRLNVLINIVGKSYKELFDEFEGNLDPTSVQGSGDVKYHKGLRGTFVARSGRSIDISLASNPSHLEAVCPVVEGMARAIQDQLSKTDGAVPARDLVLPVLVHGDAAFAGQGVVAETLNMSALAAYDTGGTVHLVVNNQLGFTTDPRSARSSVYPTDVAKMVQAPILHVNGDDPEACVRVARLALAFRQEFHKDVVIDMVCYRRYGHNEQDDPSLTQPLLYKLINEHRSVRKLYTEVLVRRGDITLKEAEDALADFSRRLQDALNETRASAPPRPTSLPPALPPSPPVPMLPTGVAADQLQLVVEALSNYPGNFTPHPKIARVLEARARLWAQGQVDWALGELLAYGSLLLEGHDVRLCGQDTRRGTFGHRNAVYVDYLTGAEHVPLAELSAFAAGKQATKRNGTTVPVGRFFLYDSLLSEYAALGFDYGYSLFSPDALVVWEAQFGDFANGAQVVVDQFIAAAEAKWEQTSGLVLFLPHGYEGQGPEHSSARVERFLALCAGSNMCVANVTTAGQLFHLLRRQVYRPAKSPLVVFTPKRYLRGREAYSKVGELTGGTFQEVLGDVEAGADEVGRVVLASGKFAVDLMGARAVAGRRDVAVVRVEQLYPWPREQLAAGLARYPGAHEVVWAQEEPANMGALGFVKDKLVGMVAEGCTIGYVSRPPSASPATGSHALHELEQADVLSRALGTQPGQESRQAQ